MLYGLSSRLQTHDFADVTATKVLATDLEHDFAVARSAGCIVCVLNHHATDEESAIFPAAAKAGDPLVTSLIEEHHGLTRREMALARESHALLSLESPEARVAAGIRLNQSANDLFGAYLAHMNREELELVPLMREHFTDEQQIAMRSAIIGGMPPERLFSLLGWMLPSLNVTELAALLSSIRKTAPPPVVKAVTDLGAAKVDPTRWAEVKLRVGM